MFAHSHPIDIASGSMLARYTGVPDLIVNSVHYQAIDRLGEGLIVNATSRDGVIEAIWATGTPAPVFAVQWHPEWRPERASARPRLLELSWRGGANAVLACSIHGNNDMTKFDTRLFIAGEFVAGEGTVELAHEPALGTVLAEVPSASAAQVEAAVNAAHTRLQGLGQADRPRSAAPRCCALPI